MILWKDHMLSFLRKIDNALQKHRLSRNQNIRIHPSAKVNFRGIKLHPNVRLEISKGSILEAAIISDKDGAVITIGENCFIGCSTLVVARNITIGNDVLISWGCSIVDHNSHAVDFRLRKDDVRNWYKGYKDWTNVMVMPVWIKDRAWIGFNTIILKGSTIGEGAVVGAGSVVTNDIPDYTIAAGNPARVIREIQPGAE